MQSVRDKNVLVTGGTGFIGKSLTKTLLDAGAQVFVLTRQQHLSSKKINYISSLAEIGGKNIDVIINLAGETIAQRWTRSAKQKIRNSRIDMTSRLVEYIEKSSSKPSVFISGSAIGFYGANQNTEFEEDTQPTNSSPFSHELCVAWEAEALKAQKYGVRIVLLRIGAVLEKDGGMLAKLLTPFRVGMGGPMGHGRQWLSWIDRDDLVRLILYIIQNPGLDGPVNATAPYPVSNQYFAKTLADAVNRPSLLRTPAMLLRAVFGEMADEIMLVGQKVIPRKALENGFIFSYQTIEKSLRKIVRGKSESSF